MQDFYAKIKIKEQFNVQERMGMIAERLKSFGSPQVTLRNSTVGDDIKFIHVMIAQDEPVLSEEQLVLIIIQIGSWLFELIEVTKAKPWMET